MSEIKEKKEVSFTDYLSILLKWKKFFIPIMFFVAVLAVVVSLLLPNKYKAYSTVIVQEEQSALGGFASALNNINSVFGGNLLSNGSSNIEKIFGYFDSKRILMQLIDEYNLIEYYGYTEYISDRTLKSFHEDFKADLTDNGFVIVTMIHESPDTSALIVARAIELVDSLSGYISLTNATNYRKFIEKRYHKNIADLKIAEEKQKEFQAKYGIYAVPEQLQISLEALGKLESELLVDEFTLDFIKSSKGTEGVDYKVLNQKINKMRAKIDRINSGIEPSKIMLPIDIMPEIYYEFVNIFRDVEIQNKLMEFILPIYEQSVMEEQKNIPNIIIVDKAEAPELKDSPKRSLIVLTSLFFVFIIVFIIILRGEKLLTSKNDKNHFELLEAGFYSKIAKTFRIKL